MERVAHRQIADKRANGAFIKLQMLSVVRGLVSKSMMRALVTWDLSKVLKSLAFPAVTPANRIMVKCRRNFLTIHKVDI